MILSGQSLVDRAREVATKAHEGQFRADKKTPYITHPQDVASRFIADYYAGSYRILSSDDEYRGQAVAWLRDAVKDGGITFEQLEQEGFHDIIPTLQLLTHFEGDSYLDYILLLKRSHNNLAIQVKLADMEANLADLHNIPSAGARKGLKTKYEMARHILTHP